MVEPAESGSKPEEHEQYFSPRDLLEQYERVGAKAEARFATDNPSIKSYNLPSHFEGVFPLKSGARAKFGWDKSPVYYRPESRLPSGSITTKRGEYGIDQHTELYVFQRYISGDSVQTIIMNFTYGADGRETSQAPQLMDDEKLCDIHEALEEIEQAIDNPSQPMDWHRYGVSYVW